MYVPTIGLNLLMMVMSFEFIEFNNALSITHVYSELELGLQY